VGRFSNFGSMEVPLAVSIANFILLDDSLSFFLWFWKMRLISLS
jgi:hypothetical protein